MCYNFLSPLCNQGTPSMSPSLAPSSEPTDVPSQLPSVSPTEGVKFQTPAQLQQAIATWEEEQCVANNFECETAERWGAPMNSWSVGLIDDMSGLFAGNADFNQAIGGWDTSR